MIYFVVWSDYDGSRVDPFESKEACEAKVTELQAIIDGNDHYGTSIDAVIYGNRVPYETIHVAAKVVIKDGR